MKDVNRKSKRTILFAGAVLVAMLLFSSLALAQDSQVDDWHARYWNNVSWSGEPARQRMETMYAPDYGWGEGSPVSGIQPEYFSARWTTDHNFTPGHYRFFLQADDGARLWVDKKLILDIKETGRVFTADIDITTSGKAPIRLDFYEEKGNAGVHLSWQRIGETTATGPIRAEYFNNTSLQGSPALIRNEGPTLHHDWGNGSPDPRINSDQFSARYSQAVNLGPGWYRFTTRSDDGIRFWINNQLVIDKWYDSSHNPVSADIYLPGGVVNLLVHYYENVGGASVSVTMTRLSSGGSGGSGGSVGGGTGGGGAYPGPDSGGSGGGFGGGTSSSGGTGGGLGGGTLPPASTTAVVNTTALNMRSGPGTEYEPIRTLYRGEVVTLTGLYDGYWVNVVTQDKFSGWVSAQYLNYNMPTGDSFTIEG